MLNSLGDFDALIRVAAFQLLLRTGEPVSPQQLARATGAKLAQVDAALQRMQSAGRIRTDQGGSVVGSAGLSVTEDRHEIDLEGRRFWTWCAYDILGIFGALKASGRALSPSPTGRIILVHFRRGRPVGSDSVLFRPDDDVMSCCENVYEEWCSNSNLFPDAEQARSWAETHSLSGRVMGLDEASDLATLEWADVTAGYDRGRPANAQRN